MHEGVKEAVQGSGRASYGFREGILWVQGGHLISWPVTMAVAIAMGVSQSDHKCNQPQLGYRSNPTQPDLTHYWVATATRPNLQA